MKRYLAIHEAGHVVVADVLGFMPMFVRDVDDRLEVGIDMPPDDERSPHENYACAAIALAGGAAQNKFGEPPDCGCLDDLNFAVEHVLGYLGDALDHDDPKASIDPVLFRTTKLAQALVEAYWPTIEAVADLIERNAGNVSQDELAAALAHNRSGEFVPIVGDVVP